MGKPTSSREDILQRVRANLGVSIGDSTRRSQAMTALITRTPGPRPAMPCDVVTLAARFRSKSESMASTIDSVGTLSEVPAAVAAYLVKFGLSPSAVCWPELASLDWSAAGLSVAARSATSVDAVGITTCFCAIAETGTLMLVSGPQTAASTSLLPETHIAVVPHSRIVPAMEEGFAQLRAKYGNSQGPDFPRAVNFVSGPSRTGDIEQTIVLGAHGPYRVHLILVAEA